MAGLIIAPKARIFHGHDWVYGTEVRTVFGNPQPQIVARRFSRRKQDLDRDFFARRIGMAASLRERMLPGETLMRLVWSESDGLPGLIVDRYGDVLVVQTLTMAMYLHPGLIRDILGDLFNPRSIIVRNGADPKWDLIILDPPSFTRNKKSLGGAMRGYKEIHLRAMQMLPVGGVLSTFCCSHHASAAIFKQTIADAAVDGHCTLRLVKSHGQSPDHPVLLNIPETEYLKGYTFEMVPGR